MSRPHAGSPRPRDPFSDAASAEARPGFQEALGQSEAFLAFQERISRVARVDRPVLLIGDRGTGKELAASRIHYLSKRWQEPFITLNCSALPPTLIEAELFGHEEGAFTGAIRQRTGRFESAHGGTLFLDEVGSIPIEVQEKILRVVEYGTFERVGSSQPIRVDVRIVGATNADLRDLAAQGRFKEDFLDRLSFEVLFLPPLRERHEDIMLLANHFGARMAFELGWPGIPEFTDEAVATLEQYQWPGNVRELKNVVERAVYRSTDTLITEAEVIFDPFLSPFAPPGSQEVAGEGTRSDQWLVAGKRGAGPASTVPPLPPATVPPATLPLFQGKSFDEAICEVEVLLVGDALARAKFNQRKAAELLGLTYHQFRGLYRKHQDRLGDEGPAGTR